MEQNSALIKYMLYIFSVILMIDAENIQYLFFYVGLRLFFFAIEWIFEYLKYKSYYAFYWLSAKKRKFLTRKDFEENSQENTQIELEKLRNHVKDEAWLHCDKILDNSR